MLSTITGATLFGINAIDVTIEVDVSNGLPKEHITGLPDATIKESKNRIKAAMKNSGFQYPPKVFTINLAPADLHKEGPLFDLPIALGMLEATGQIDLPNKSALYIGELSLDGKIQRVKGCISICYLARQKGIKTLYVPQDNLSEAQLIPDLDIIPVSHLTEFIESKFTVHPTQEAPKPTITKPPLELNDVKGQMAGKRALEIAASGHHNILLIGSPGCGKSMLIKRLPYLLSQMTTQEAIETFMIQSISPKTQHSAEFSYQRPFRAPHHSISHVALVGGGKQPQPGEMSMAHNGVLFLDELPEFQRLALESLRQPLEDQRIQINRANFEIEYPAKFILAAAMNPCPCGYYNDPKRECRCHPSIVKRYWKKISGPILDRIDIILEISRLEKGDMHSENPIEFTSENIKSRILETQQIQTNRYKKNLYNAQLSQSDIQSHCKIDSDIKIFLDLALDSGILTGRSYHKVIKLARTLADMERKTNIEMQHITEALQYRPPEYLS